jgi:hypothetical protein
MQQLTNDEKKLYNNILEYSYSEPYVTLAAIHSLVHKAPYILTDALANLEDSGLLLAGLEDTTDLLKFTYTPIVKGSALGYPCDEYSWDEWLANALVIDTGEEYD